VVDTKANVFWWRRWVPVLKPWSPPNPMEILCALIGFALLLLFMAGTSTACLGLAGASVKQIGKVHTYQPKSGSHPGSHPGPHPGLPPKPQRGEIADRLSGQVLKNGPEEQVRQVVLKYLLDQGFSRTQLNTEFPVQMGSSTRYIDIAVFPHGCTHHQDSVWMVVECKRRDLSLSLRDKGVLQLKSYLAVCPNAQYGLFTTSALHVILKRKFDGRRLSWLTLDQIPNFHEELADDCLR